MSAQDNALLVASTMQEKHLIKVKPPSQATKQIYAKSLSALKTQMAQKLSKEDANVNYGIFVVNQEGQLSESEFENLLDDPTKQNVKFVVQPVAEGRGFMVGGMQQSVAGSQFVQSQNIMNVLQNDELEVSQGVSEEAKSDGGWGMPAQAQQPNLNLPNYNVGGPTQPTLQMPSLNLGFGGGMQGWGAPVPEQPNMGFSLA